MAPFPSRRSPSGSSILPTIHSPSQSSSSTFSLSTTALHSYPPLPPSASPSPAPSPAGSRSPSFSQPYHNGAGAGAAADTSTAPRRMQTHDPKSLFGGMAYPSPGSLQGLPGLTWESREEVRRCLEENHISSHTFFNDKGFHNHCAHHLLAAYSMGASPSLIRDILKLHHETAFKPMPPLAPIEINESNWTDFLGDENFYPNYLTFFHRLISTPPPPTSPYAGRKSSVVPVLEHYLFNPEGQMLVRAVSGAIHPLIHIGHGVEFGLDEVVAEGLAQCAVHDPRVAPLFPASWPPQPPKPSQLQSTLSSAFSSLRLSNSSSNLFGTLPTASPSDSFAATAASLPRDHSARRYPREGLSGFTILSRILQDDALAPGAAGQLSDMPKLDAVLRNRASRIVQWCEEWKFSTERSQEWDDEEELVKEGKKSNRGKSAKGWGGASTPSWDEVVEKTEELFWMATVIYASATRPGYKKVKMDFFTMHGLTSAMFLPPLLEAISPHLRPYLLTSHFRVMVSYWISRGRPELFITDTLMSATAHPFPPTSPAPSSSTAVGRSVQEALHDKHSASHDPHERSASPESPGSPQTPKAARSTPLPDVDPERDEGMGRDEEEGKSGVNPWARVLESAVDHHDEHVTKVVRTLLFAASHFGTSPPGYFTSSLPGSQAMDGSIFIRAAGLTLSSLGWAHERDPGIVGEWDRSALGYDETWDGDELLLESEGARIPASLKGKGRSRSGTVTVVGKADEEVVHFSRGDSALLSPRLGGGGGRASGEWGEGETRVEMMDQERERVGWRKVGEELTESEREEEERRAAREEEEYELRG
ncbi:hypothetical protein JCM5296_007022 [Sporobolomyces johnsonii]